MTSRGLRGLGHRWISKVDFPAATKGSPRRGIFQRIQADIPIDSAGATNPNVSHGHSKTDAERIRQMVEHFSAE